MSRGAETETSTVAQLSAPVGVRTRAWKVKTKSEKFREFQNSKVIYRKHLRNQMLNLWCCTRNVGKIISIECQPSTSDLRLEFRASEEL